jgi:mannose/fructose/N-acetylgalactosamine-specific phosphotransferase system component IIB
MNDVFYKYIPKFEYELVSLIMLIDEITDKIQERRLQEMFSFIDGYDVQETRRVAKAEGVDLSEKIIDELKQGLSAEKVSKNLNVDFETVERFEKLLK